MKICIFSDTHTKHKKLQLPEADLCIFAGDFTNVGDVCDVVGFNSWIGRQKDKFPLGILLVAGNHDCSLDPKNKRYNSSAKSFLTNVTLLENEEIIIDGIKFYGSPITPDFFPDMWAFNAPRGKGSKKYWDMIPDDVNVLITHGPPRGIGDSIPPYGNVGCDDLKNRIGELKNLKLNIFGHIHNGYGQYEVNGIKYINASILDEAYNIKNNPIVVEI